MKRKGIVFLLILLLLTAATACSGPSSGSPDSSESSISPTQTETQQKDSAQDTLSASDLSISLFEWDVREEVIADELAYRLNLKNGSPYPVLSTEIIYKTRETATNEELKQFDRFKKDHKEYVDPDDDNHNIRLFGQSESYIKPGQYLQNLPITIGIHSMTWYDTPNYDQFVLMRPASLSLGLVKNNLLYHCHYDFIEKNWSVDPDAEPLNTWPDTRLTRLIPKPPCDYYLISTKTEDSYLRITAYGISNKQYQSYVQSVKENGFTLHTDTGKNYYSAEDRKENAVDIIRDADNLNMTIHVNL